MSLTGSPHSTARYWRRLTTLLALALASTLALAETRIQTGAPLPPLAIENQGEIVIRDGRRAFEPWHSDHGLGQVQVLQYMAARLSASKINEPFTDALDAAGFEPEQVRITTILNLDDILWGSRGFVMRELESNKKKHADAIMVVDEQGKGLSHWGLAPQGSAVAIVSPDGEVALFRDGALGTDEIEQALELIRGWIGSEDTLADATAD